MMQTVQSVKTGVSTMMRRVGRRFVQVKQPPARGGGKLPLRLPLFMVGLTVIALVATPCLANDYPCDSMEEFPCSIQVESQSLAPAPTLFKLQARVVQGGMPIESAKFGKSFVRLMRGGTEVCNEEFKSIEIKDSLINLEIGPEMDCEIQDELIGGDNLAFVVCLNSPDNCLAPIPLLASPQAVRSTYAWRSARVHKTERAGQAHYAHRFSADGLDLAERNTVSRGFFEMTTPDENQAATLYDPNQFEAYKDGGFLLWTPVLDRQAMNLHLTGKKQGWGTLTVLKELVVASQETRAGRMHVKTFSGSGLTVESRGATVTGDTSLTGDLIVLGELLVDEDVVAHKGGELGGTVEVGAGLAVTGSTLTVTGDSVLRDPVTAWAGATVMGEALISGPVEFAGTVATDELKVLTDLNVAEQGNTTVAGVTVTGNAEVSGTLSAPGVTVTGDVSLGENVHLEGGMTIAGNATFNGQVTFEGGQSKPNEPLDIRYVQFAEENRDLSFAGLLTMAGGLSIAADLQGGFNRLLQAVFHASAAAPADCTAESVGLIYFDQTRHSLRVCVNGRYKPLGGGGGVCGNGLLELDSETCDDGNNETGDGCGQLCAVEDGWTCEGGPSECTTSCGDGLVVAGKEDCDDGNDDPGDGCSAGCGVEAGWSCTGQPSKCDQCGNGVIAGEEECDDGPDKHVNGDGCSTVCKLESGWECSGQPSMCNTDCGDGIAVGDEECDDGPDAYEDGDGCSIFCKQEDGWYCNGQPSECTTQCNDGIVAGAESCDDGNLSNGDGCTSSCQEQDGWTCSELLDGPSVCWKCSAELDDHCYLLTCGAAVNEEWAKARAICHERGGYLLRIDGQDETELVDTMNSGCADDIYVGLTDAGSPGQYYWVTESGGGAPQYTNWGYGQPDETSADKHCVYIEELNGDPVWWDGACTEARAYICEVPTD